MAAAMEASHEPISMNSQGLLATTINKCSTVAETKIAQFIKDTNSHLVVNWQFVFLILKEPLVHSYRNRHMSQVRMSPWIMTLAGPQLGSWFKGLQSNLLTGDPIWSHITSDKGTHFTAKKMWALASDDASLVITHNTTQTLEATWRNRTACWMQSWATT